MTKSILKITICLLTGFILSSFTKEDKYLIQWDFSKFKKLTYEVTQTVSMQMDGNNDEHEQKVKYQIIISVKNDSLADVILKMSSMKSMDIPDVFANNMRPNGTFEADLIGNLKTTFQCLFPIMSIPSSSGDSVKIPLQYPFRVMGSHILVNGFNTIKHEETKGTIHKINYTKNLADYEVPKEVDYNYICYNNGSGTFLFDSEKGYFTKGESSDTTYFKVEPKKPSKNSRINEMKSISKFELKLLNVE